MNIHPIYLSYGVHVASFDADDTQPVSVAYEPLPDADDTAPAVPVTADDTQEFIASETTLPRIGRFWRFLDRVFRVRTAYYD